MTRKMHTAVVTCSEGVLGLGFSVGVVIGGRVPVAFSSSVAGVGGVVWLSRGDRVLVPSGIWVVFLCVNIQVKRSW